MVAEHNRLNFLAEEFFYEGPDVAVIEVVAQGGLIPVEEESLPTTVLGQKLAQMDALCTLGQPSTFNQRIKLISTTK